MGSALLLKGEINEALNAMQQEPSELHRLYGLVKIYHALGQRTESTTALSEFIEKFGQIQPWNVAGLLAYRGEADRAFEWLEKAVAYKNLDLSDIVFHPQFANIHDDPRWLLFLETVGRSPEELAAIEFKVKLPR